MMFESGHSLCGLAGRETSLDGGVRRRAQQQSGVTTDGVKDRKLEIGGSL